MLVLSRKTGESIRIGTEIDVVVLGVSKGRVRLGFTMPREIPVRRAEIISDEHQPFEACQEEPAVAMC